MKNKAFTVIELIIVIGIVAVLSVIVFSSISSSRAKARDSRRIQELKEFQLLLDVYKMDKFSYPQGNFHSAALWNSFITTHFINNGYMTTLLKDPGSNQYRYYSTYSGTYTCNGVVWQNYEYVITFSLERQNNSVPKTNWSTNTHCFYGPLKK